MKIGLVTWLFFLLLGSLWREAQQAPEIERNCGEREYFNLHQRKCCSRCPPGTYASSQCSAKSDTNCKSCPVDSYNENWIYADKCKLCKSCPEDAGLVAIVNCSATTAVDCGCQDGYVCELASPLGECMHCRRVTSPAPTVEFSTGTHFWIIISVTVGLILLGFIIFLLVTNTRVLKRIVRVMGNEDNKTSSSLDATDARTFPEIVLLPGSNGTQSTDLSQNPAETTSHNTEDSLMQSVHLLDSTKGQSSDYISSFKVVSGCYPHLSIPVMSDDHLHYPIQEEHKAPEIEGPAST
ncbi:tumor necrosis factor receptor superfamily member 1B isoform X2 [Xenopus laevis]|uniref:Tumor necrosis factor receptor superfamily member 1B isoform X2 n=1 Tax=Xenopus laevis TaxID=8355 RepID=A0A8J1LCU1_XENLA|nr:tumor necrosis factor receptor superfamily member 1B isoform X2 [Xenopus laevis]